MPILLFLTALTASITAVICGTPVPATTRVVHIEPGPMPTFIASAPALANALAPAAVATLPAITSILAKLFFIAFSMSITPLVCPCALSRHITSTPTLCRASTLCKVSLVMPTPAPTSKRPLPSFTACGWFFSFSISPKVTRPISLPALFTTGNFSILFFLKMSSAFFKSVPSGAVMRLSFVITWLTLRVRFISKRKSRLVSMPTNLLALSTMGMPPILLSLISCNASPTVASGSKVMGSSINPFSLRFTLRTCSACKSILIFLCNIPNPPSRAKAMAKVASVTVSIAALSRGTFRVIFLVSRVCIFTSRGSTCEYAGISNTSSKVRPSPKNLFTLLLLADFIVAIGKDTKDALIK